MVKKEMWSVRGIQEGILSSTPCQSCGELDRQRKTFWKDLTQTLHCFTASIVTWHFGFMCSSVRTTSGNRTDGPFSYSDSYRKEPNLSVRFPVSDSVQMISVKVQTHNKLGTAESTTLNYTLSDISKTSISHQPQSFHINCHVLLCKLQKRCVIAFVITVPRWLLCNERFPVLKMP